jgi:hypothetical protein
MRSRVVAAIFGVAGILAAAPAYADHEPTYVVPGRADVPVMINGVDAAWGVIEGDWGLYRPGHGAVTVIPAPFAAPLLPPARRYYPSLGGLPYSGRLEVEPPANRQLPPSAPSYHRSWSSSSDPLPASEPVQLPPIFMAPITVPPPTP